MENNNIDSFTYNLREHNRLNSSNISFGASTGLLAADAGIVIGSVFDKTSAFYGDYLGCTIGATLISSIALLGIFECLSNGKKVKLCKEKMRNADLTEYQDLNSINFKPNDILSSKLDHEERVILSKRKGRIRNIAVFGSMLTLPAAIVLASGNHTSTMIWTAFWIANTIKLASPLIADKTTKKLIKQVKENGRVL